MMRIPYCDTCGDAITTANRGPSREYGYDVCQPCWRQLAAIVANKLWRREPRALDEVDREARLYRRLKEHV